MKPPRVSRIRSHSLQRGVALIAILAVVMMGALWGLMTSLSAASNRTQGNADHNARVLAEAKKALLGHIVAQAGVASERHPGRLPCPEPIANAGSATLEGYAAAQAPAAATACANVGRFPWRTAGTDKLIDAQGQPLWYAVTIGDTEWAFATSASVLSINSNKLGGLSVNGQANAAVAVIIAPGGPLTTTPNANQTAAGCVARIQTRPIGAPNYQDYLECHNFATPNVRTTVIDNATNVASNDQVVTITAKEVMSAIEGVIEARLKSDVVPQLSAVYNSTTWGASAASPYFPFPARFKNDAGSTFNPESYQGHRFSNDGNTAGALTQGLLPMTAGDSSFVFFNSGAGAITVTINAGSAATSASLNCTGSGATLVTCTITHSKTCVICLFGGLGTESSLSIRVSVRNVGMSLKTLNSAAVSTTGFLATPVPSLTAPLQTDGSATLTYTGSVLGSGANGILGSILCGSLISIVCSGTASITVPIAAFQQHALVNPATADAWYWFVTNKWHEVTYYAVAQNFLPGGSRSCGTCLSLSGDTTLSNVQALLVLAGRSLTQTARPNTDITDYLDAANADGDATFKDATVTASNNDRVAVVK